MTSRLTHLAIIALLGLTACGGSSRPPVNLGTTGSGPDEFAIVPNRELAPAPSGNPLPPPTPGATNRADARPQADAVAALGGSPAALGQGGVPAGQSGIVAYAERFGAEGDIRDQLAQEDETYRRDNRGRLLERVFNSNVYDRAYEADRIDPDLEIERARQAGISTPDIADPDAGID